MKLPFQPPSLGVPQPRPAWCAQLASKPAVRVQPQLKILLPPQANYKRTHPAFLFPNSSTCSPKPLPKPNTIEYA
jgi:hypothetical protein